MIKAPAGLEDMFDHIMSSFLPRDILACDNGLADGSCASPCRCLDFTSCGLSKVA